MSIRLIISICCMSFSMMALAQASGGQIRRANRLNEQGRHPHSSATNKINNHEFVDLGCKMGKMQYRGS